MLKILICVSLLLIIISVVSFFIIKSLIKKNNKLKCSVEDLQASVERLERNIDLFAESINKQMEIKNNEIEVSKKISEAQTDEELFAIAGDIIKRNNDRVRNKSKKQS